MEFANDGRSLTSAGLGGVELQISASRLLWRARRYAGIRLLG